MIEVDCKRGFLRVWVALSALWICFSFIASFEEVSVVYRSLVHNVCNPSKRAWRDDMRPAAVSDTGVAYSLDANNSSHPVDVDLILGGWKYAEKYGGWIPVSTNDPDISHYIVTQIPVSHCFFDLEDQRFILTAFVPPFLLLIGGAVVAWCYRGFVRKV